MFTTPSFTTFPCMSRTTASKVTFPTVLFTTSTVVVVLILMAVTSIVNESFSLNTSFPPYSTRNV